MKIQTQLHNTIDTLRNFAPLDDSLKIMIICGAALSLDPEETLSVLKLGEQDMHNYLNVFYKKYSKASIHPINKNIKLLDVFRSLQNIFNQIGKDSKKMAEILMDVYVENMNAQRWMMAATENPSSAELLSKLTAEWPKKSLFDGAAGVGYLASLVNAQKTFLCDSNDSTQDITLLLFKMMGKEIDYVVEDTLLSSEKSRNVDLVITHPPYGIRLDTKNDYSTQKYLLIDQTIPSSASDSLWIQQGLYQLNNNGKMIVQMALGWLFRSGYDAKLRYYLIENRLISGLIFLPESLSPATMIGTALVILDKNQSTSVRLIDARKMGTMDKAKGFKTFSPDEIEKIVNAFQNGDEDVQFCKDASFEQIRKNEYNLSANKYFSAEIELVKLNLSTETEKLTQLKSQFIESSTKFNDLLKKLMD